MVGLGAYREPARHLDLTNQDRRFRNLLCRGRFYLRSIGYLKSIKRENTYASDLRLLVDPSS